MVDPCVNLQAKAGGKAKLGSSSAAQDSGDEEGFAEEEGRRGATAQT